MCIKDAQIQIGVFNRDGYIVVLNSNTQYILRLFVNKYLV